MSTDNGDSGSKDRATVALVNAKLDEVKAIVAGHADTTAAKLDAIGEKVDALGPLADRMARLEEKVAVLWGDRSWRRVHWPTFLVSLAAVGLAGVALFL